MTHSRAVWEHLGGRRSQAAGTAPEDWLRRKPAEPSAKGTARSNRNPNTSQRV